jgi:phospholipase C
VAATEAVTEVVQAPLAATRPSAQPVDQSHRFHGAGKIVGFDHYFGHLPEYWAANGFPSQQFDAEPANASNPAQDGSATIQAFHFRTVCMQNMSPGWNESHVDWNRADPVSDTATLDGFVQSAAHFAQTAGPGDAPVYDQQGYRAMGYYDGDDLNYYYFMASSFATSDRWFSPVMSRTQVNRLYLLPAT